MNWTGGHLNRHSYKSANSTAAIQKRFARARSKLQNTTKAPSPFKIPTWAAADNARNVSLAQSDSRLGGSDIARQEAQQSTQDSELHEQDGQETPNSTGQPETIGDFKQSLLTRKDWANLSILRSPKMKFISGEERYNFGRRRPLTEADRQRRATAGEVTRPRQFPSEKRPRRTRREGTSSAQINSDEISIRIGERAAPSTVQSGRSPSVFQSQESNDSMLLDRVENARGVRTSRSPTPIGWETTPNTDVSIPQPYVRPEGEQLQRSVNGASPSVILSLPVLDRHGTFAVEGNEVKYVPPKPPRTPGVDKEGCENNFQQTSVRQTLGKDTSENSRHFSPHQNIYTKEPAIRPIPFAAVERVGNSPSIVSPNYTGSGNFRQTPTNTNGWSFESPVQASAAATPCPPRRFNGFAKPHTPRLRQANIFIDQEHRAQYQGHPSPYTRYHATRFSPAVSNERITVYGQELQRGNDWPTNADNTTPQSFTPRNPRFRTNSQLRKITVYGQTVEFPEDDWPK